MCSIKSSLRYNLPLNYRVCLVKLKKIPSHCIHVPSNKKKICIKAENMNISTLIKFLTLKHCVHTGNIIPTLP